jgi:hypothetical protein
MSPVPSRPSTSGPSQSDSASTLEEELRELRESEDPRTDPEFPYTEEWEHLEEKWPEEPSDRFERYVVKWSEDRRNGDPLVRCKAAFRSLLKARRFAQRESVKQETSGSMTWVMYENGSEEADTVDVWNGGFRLPNHHWTKEGTPPHRPTEAA